MKKLHRAFWISFGIYSVLTLLGTVVVERNENDLGFLINMKRFIPFMKYYSLVGLIFFITAFIMMWRSRLRLKKAISHFDIEKKEMKASILQLKKEISKLKQADEASEMPKTED